MTASTTLVLYGFETSNNMKVRIALGCKGIEYEFVTIRPEDREEIVRISGQYLTPVLVHGDRVVFDSAAILRYLDHAFPGTPKLFGSSHAEQWEIEDHELFARTALAGPMMDVVHRRVYGRPVDEELQSSAAASFAGAVEKLAARLQGRQWLVGDHVTAADITTAPVLHRVRSAGILPMPPVAGELEDWVRRVMRFDGQARTG